MYSEMIIFLEDLKSLLLDINIEDEHKNEIITEVVDLIDNKILELES